MQNNMFGSQVTGFARWQVFALIAATAGDFAQCWRGTEISDSYVTGLRELVSAGKLAGKLTDKAVLFIKGRALFGFNVTRKGDVYERREGVLTVRGSLALLAKIYGAKNVGFCTVAEFDKMSASLKVDKKDSELQGIAKAKSKAKKAKSEEEGEE